MVKKIIVKICSIRIYYHFLSSFFLQTDIINHYIILNESGHPIQFLGLHLNDLWLYVLGNVITQHICLLGVFTLFGTTSSLTGTLAISLRKFMSLLISIWYFNNEFTNIHWIGTVFVFTGTLLYTFAKDPPKKDKNTEVIVEKTKKA